MPLIIILIVILAVLLVVFTLQNPLDINLTIFFWELNDAPLVLVLIACAFLGFLLSTFYFSPRIWRIKKEYNQLVKFNNELQTIKNSGENRTIEELNPEGIMLEDDDDDDSFFKD